MAYYKGFRAVLLGYIATTASGQVRSSEISKAMKSFEEAYKFFIKNLSPANPLSISIASNFFDFQCYVAVSVDKGLANATEAYNKGLSHLHEIPEDLKFRSKEMLDVLKFKIDYLKHQK